MDWITYILTGGFLKGYRTQIAAALLVLNVVAGYLMGDIGFVEALKQSWEQIVIAFGLLASSVHKVK
jgi:hypothetical protein